MKNTFSIRGGTPVVNGVPIRRVRKCKVESIPLATTVSLEFDIPNGYRLAQREAVTFDFGFALEALKQGKRVRRTGWNGKNMWLRIVIPDECKNEKFDMGMENLPFIEMKTADDKLVPWIASQTDILAEDWMVAE